MKRITCLFLTLCLLAGCALAGAESRPSPGKPYENPNLYTVLPAERPGPEENYNLYVNYDLYADAYNGINLWYSDFRERLNHHMAQRVMEICRNPEYTDPESEIIRILYKLASDTEKLERDGLAPLMAKVDRVKAVRTLDELTALIGEDGFLLSAPFIMLSKGMGGKESDSELYIVSMAKQELPFYITLPDDQTEEEMMEDPEGQARKWLTLMQYSEEEAARLVEKISRYDSGIPEDQETGAPAEDTPPDYSDIPEEQGTWLDKPLISLQEIRENSPALYAQLEGAGMLKENAETQPVYEIEKIGITSFLNWYREENLETFKAIVALTLYNDAMPYLDRERLLASYLGSSAKDDERFAYDRLNAAASVPLNQSFVTHCVPEETWEMAVNLFEDIRKAMGARIESKTWLSAESRQKCLEKLADLKMSQITPPGGNFDCGLLLEKLRGCENLLDAAAFCKRFVRLCEMRFTGEKIIKGNPYTGVGVLVAGGQYDPNQNMFCIGAGTLDGPACDTTSRETLLGTLGMHIAHELSHAFDNQGIQRNAAGEPMLTEEEIQTYNEEVKPIAAKLSQIETGNGNYLPGELVSTEVIADLEGMRLMLDLAKQEESFDYDAFFRASAKFFFDYRAGDDNAPDAGTGYVDSHPPYYVRINFCVAHFDEFYQTYPTVKEGAPMYIAPEDRVMPW